MSEILSPELPAPPPPLRAAITAAWARDEAEQVRDLLETARQPLPEWGESDRSGIQATAADLVRAGDAVLAGLRGDGLISRETTQLFLQTGVLAEQALGFRRWPTAGGTAYGHTGFPGVAWAILPEQQRTVVLVTNRLHVTGAPRPTEPLWSEVLLLLSEGER